MRFIQNAAKPYKMFKTAAAVEKFMNREVKDLEKRVIRVVKVLGLFYDRKEMVEEIEHFKVAARYLRNTPEI